ncbi:MAG: FAD-binding oxidoreductase [Chloracidobacterium sp.]|nr:FAD-binding oxidoreductase [Chloracidobacterium sp.]MDW8218195.1 FAD-binding oxidoreductase [Acidobacteriota bacterium]
MPSTSFWQATAGAWRPPVLEPTTFDCLIVGGGVAGISAAYALAQLKPLWKLAVVDRRQVGGGATGRNAGFLLAGTADHYAVSVARYGRTTARDVFALTVASHRRIRDFLAQHPTVDCDYTPCGSLLLAGTSDEAETLAHSVTLLREDGFDVTFIPSDPLRRGFHAAIHNPHDAGVHPVKLVRALAAVSRAAVFEYWPVLGLEANQGELLVHGVRGVLRAVRVLLALNGEAPSFAGFFADKVFPKRGQIFVTAPYGRRLLDKVVYANEGYEYFRQLPDGRFLFGGGRRAFAATEVGTDETPTAAVQSFLESFRDRHFPELANVPVEYRWAGVMGFTRDGLPLMGSLPGYEQAWFTIACHGHGMGFSLEAGRLAARMVIDGDPPPLFDVRRLHTGSPPSIR